MNGLSSALSHCKAGCYINEQCMNHIMYADDICVMAPTAIALQKLLDMCFEYSIANDLLFNPVNLCALYLNLVVSSYTVQLFLLEQNH